MNVDLVAENDVAGVLANTEGGVVASVPEDATLHFNGNTEVPVDRADVTLFSDDLLPGNREDALIDRAEQALSIDLSAAQQASTYDFQYLDLVDVRQSNAWVSSSDDTAIYWRLPEGADASSIQIIHFKDLHRDTAMDDTTVADLIGKAEVETMEILNKDSVAADGYVKFAVPTSGFSPFLMVWTAADPGVDPDPDPGTGGNPGGGPGADPEPEPEGSVQVPESEGGQTTVANPEARPDALSQSLRHPPTAGLSTALRSRTPKAIRSTSTTSARASTSSKCLRAAPRWTSTTARSPARCPSTTSPKVTGSSRLSARFPGMALWSASAARPCSTPMEASIAP